VTEAAAAVSAPEAVAGSAWYAAGVDPRWSRVLDVTDGAGRTHRWHLLDRGPRGTGTRLTVLCVHGNPTWSYLWRHLIATAPEEVRVIAVDQLGMGLSERTREPRRLSQRIDDLLSLTDALDLAGPVVVVAHDWGGPVSLGWVAQVRTYRPEITVSGIVLLATAVAQPAHLPAPWPIRLARLPGVRGLLSSTSLFIRSTLRVGAADLSPDEVAGYLLPYQRAAHRRAIADFVADIPLGPRHRSAVALRAVAESLTALDGLPVLLLFGGRDPVFGDAHLRDLCTRLPLADVHRYPDGRHLLPEDDRVIAHVWQWVATRLGPTEPAPPEPGEFPAEDVGAIPLWEALLARADSDDPALTLLTNRGQPTRVTWRELARQVALARVGLSRLGVRPGERVALLLPPGPELAAVLYACWWLGATAVLSDAGSGLAPLRANLAAAGVHHAVAVRRAHPLLGSLRLPGRIVTPAAVYRAARRGDAEIAAGEAPPGGEGGAAGGPVAGEPGPSALAAVVYTSGATGPAKGVRYTHGQIAATCTLLAEHYDLTDDDVLIAAFAPWALLGPALGIASVIPAMDLTRPGTLTATALGQALTAAGGTFMWCSPASLRSIIATADEWDRRWERTRRRVARRTGSEPASPLASVRLVLVAGAPVPAPLLEQAAVVFPAADLRTPYGMTEVLPVTEAGLAEVQTARGDGVLVGGPLPGVTVGIAPLGIDGRPATEPGCPVGVTGEVLVRAAHQREGYDRLWAVEAAASIPAGWHRTGDVGHLDADGRLWIEGRLRDVLHTAHGPITPVGIEQAGLAASGCEVIACVGVGPIGTQQVVLVGSHRGAPGSVVSGPAREAGPQVCDDVRADAAERVPGAPAVAAFLLAPALPVDPRHGAKVDRRAVAQWAGRVLSGEAG